MFTSVLTSWQTKCQIPTNVLTFSGISSINCEELVAASAGVHLEQPPVPPPLAKMMSHSEVFRRFSIKVSAIWDASKASFKITVTLFLLKNIYLWLKLILIYNTNILTNLGNLFLWRLKTRFSFISIVKFDELKWFEHKEESFSGIKLGWIYPQTTCPTIYVQNAVHNP